MTKQVDQLHSLFIISKFQISLNDFVSDFE